jgi:DNA-directed RNA polymerase subunit RPC12/RpoP
MSASKEFTRGLLVRGIAAAKAGEQDSARSFLERVRNLRAPREQHIDALYWLSEISEDEAEVRELVDEILSYNPRHARARRKLAMLNGELDEADIIDPDTYRAAASQDAAQATSRQFDCPNCGGRMVFSPLGGELICEYCESTAHETKENAGLKESDFIVGLATAKGHRQPIDMRVFECHTCGATFLLTPETISISCPHCDHNYSVEHAQFEKVIPPEGIVPFSTGEEDAKTALGGWLEENGNTEKTRIKNLRGVYLPVWTFDVGGELTWRCMVYTGGEEWEAKQGAEPVFFDDLLIPASKPLPEKMRESMRQFDLRGAVPYDPKYLASWLAETYQLKLSDAALDARKLALDIGREQVRRRLSGVYRDLRIGSSSMAIDSFKLMLLPFWIAHYSYSQKSKIFEATINGQTGKVFGEPPATGLKKLLNWVLEKE